MNTIQEIEPEERDEPIHWFGQYNRPDSVDPHLQALLADGCFDGAVEQSLEDDRNGRVRPL